jgi:general secretion pathway protein L
MSTLILTLPLFADSGAPEYEYVLTTDGQQSAAQGRAAAALLPTQTARKAEVVVVIPARALSWHGIALPERVLRSLLAGRMEPARARGVLAGVLEEQLLDDPEQLHFAIFAGAPQPDASPQAWVAVCARAWLHTHVQTLEAAGYQVGRIVAECTPAQPGTATALLSDAIQPAQMLLCTPQGVSLLPLVAASLQLAQTQDALEVFAEPSVMALAEAHFGNQTTLQTREQRLLQAAQSPWNLAQLEFSASRSGRLLKRLANAWQQLRQAPQWRPARWSLVALVLVQVVGLNALAWRERSLLDVKRAAVQDMLTQTFPDVHLVVDAPKQMQRAVEDLARNRGVGSDTDIGRVFSVISPLAPKGMALSAIRLNGKQLRLTATGTDAASSSALIAALDARGLRAQWQDGDIVVEPKEAR